MSQLKNREDLRRSLSNSSGLCRPTPYNQSLKPIPKPYGFDTYPPPGGRATGQENYHYTSYPELNANQNFGPSRSNTPVGSPHLDQLKQTLLVLSVQNQMAINQLIETQTSQKEAFTIMVEAEEKSLHSRFHINTYF